MPHPSHYVSGDNNAVCDQCGRSYKASTLKKTWDGFYVCPKHWEPRHPQDYAKNIREDPSVAINRRRGAPTYTAEAQAMVLPPNPLGV